MSSDVAIRVENLSKCYHIYATPRDRLRQLVLAGLQRFSLPHRQFDRCYREFWALQDISFSVKKGEAVAVIGRNGSGKSTLLQLLCGTLAATSGQVHIDGRVTGLLELGAGFNPDFTGRENVWLNAAIHGLGKREIAARFDEIVDFADIGAFIDQPVKTYSSGMYVRLAFAVQACLQPDILVVDEALAVGDEKFQRKCFAFIDRLRSDGTSILLVTHSIATVEKFCQRALLLEKGRLHGVGAAKTIIDQYHALLYADEAAYRRLLAAGETAALSGGGEGDRCLKVNPAARARIESVFVSGSDGRERHHFRPGEQAIFSFSFTCLEAIAEIQAGIRIRTVEGVEVFGTTSRFFTNYRQAMAGDRLRAVFELPLNFCAGAYYVSVAIAEPTPADMRYLDKHTDVLTFRMIDQKPVCSGLVHLHPSVEIIDERLATAVQGLG